MVCMDGASALAHVALVGAFALAKWTAFAVARVALEGAISFASRAVFHVGLASQIQRTETMAESKRSVVSGRRDIRVQEVADQQNFECRREQKP